MAIFRTQVQADILARVLLADEPIAIADLARELEPLRDLVAVAYRGDQGPRTMPPTCWPWRPLPAARSPRRGQVHLLPCRSTRSPGKGVAFPSGPARVERHR